MYITNLLIVIMDKYYLIRPDNTRIVISNIPKGALEIFTPLGYFSLLPHSDKKGWADGDLLHTVFQPLVEFI